MLREPEHERRTRRASAVGHFDPLACGVVPSGSGARRRAPPTLKDARITEREFLSRVGATQRARALARTVAREAWYGLSGDQGEAVLALVAHTHGDDGLAEACRAAELMRDLGRSFSWGEIRLILSFVPFVHSRQDMTAGTES